MTNSLLWLVGNWESPDFAPAADWLSSHAECRQIDPNSTEAGSDLAPAAVVVVQSRPGEFSKAEVAQLQAAAHGALVLVVAGPWCEGELRSGTPLTGVTRIEWRRWKCGFEAELAPLLQPAAERQQPQYSLPSDMQLIARNLRAVRRVKPEVDTAVVCTDSLPLFESLADSLSQFRIRARRAASDGDLLASAKLILYDGWPQFECASAAAAMPSDGRKLLLLDWPRPADAQRAKDAGIHEIISLPFLLSDLATEISA